MADTPVELAPPGIPSTRPHPGWIISAALSSVRSFIAAFIAIAFSVRDQGIIVITFAMLVPGLLIIGWRAIQWQAMRYSAQDGAISLSTGLLEKNERTIQVERIQSVDTLETPIGRILGVSELQIATAGAAQPITIPAISAGEAERLREWIDASRSRVDGRSADLEQAERPNEPAHSTVVHQMSGRDVLLAGLTAGRIAPALAIAAAAWRLGSDILPESLRQRVPIDPDRLTPASVVALIAAAAAMAWGLSIAGAALSLWNFTVQRAPDSLILNRGLLDRKQNTIPVSRIQAISVVEGVLRQPFGFASVMIESAAKPHGDDESGGARHLFPFVRKRDILRLIEAALPEFSWSDAGIDLHRLPARARSRYLIPVIRDFAIGLVVTCGVLSWLPRVEWWYGLFLLPLLPVWLAFGYLQFRDAGWSLDSNDRLFVQQRSFDRSLLVTRGRRVQVRELSSNPLQRRAHLGSLTLLLATIGGRGTITINHLDHDDGEQLLASLSPHNRPPI
ncbi:PH domain-containing protein [soil metagenome]